jgi:hypothetical protein
MLIGGELLEGLTLRKSVSATRPLGRPVEASLGRERGSQWGQLA